ncbi:MAG: DUF58 domain-containing protein [Planctomycetota bacterium]
MTRIRPTRLGVEALIFFTLLLVGWLATPYSNLFFLLLAFFACLMGLGVLWALGNLRGVGGRVEDFAPQPARQPILAGFVLDPGRRPKEQVEVVLELDDGEGTQRARVGAVAVLEHRTALEGVLPPLPRGIHRIRSAWVRSSFPFGGVLVQRRIPAPERIVVHPAPLELRRGAPRSLVLAELGERLVTAGARVQPSGLREFRQGDEARRVHWRASARRGSLVVLEWDGEAEEALEVVLDRRADRKPFERALSVLAALGLRAQELGETLHLCSQGVDLAFGEGGRPIRELLHWLAEAEPLAPEDPPPPPCSPAALRLPFTRDLEPEARRAT